MHAIFRASYNSDSLEGRGGKIVVGYFLQKEDAQMAVKGKGVMGQGDGNVEEVDLFDSIAEFQNIEEGKLRRQALAKLSSAERAALGFGDR